MLTEEKKRKNNEFYKVNNYGVQLKTTKKILRVALNPNYEI